MPSSYEIESSKRQKAKGCTRSTCPEGGKVRKGQICLTRVIEHNEKVIKHSFHLTCYSDTQKSNIRKKFSSASEFTGYDALAAADKARVNELFGWAQEPVEALHEGKASLLDTPSSDPEPESIFDDDPQEPSIDHIYSEPLLNDKSSLWNASATEGVFSSDQVDDAQLRASEDRELSSLYAQLSSLASVPLAASTGNSNDMFKAATRSISPAQTEAWYGNVPSWEDNESSQAAQLSSRTNKGKENVDVTRQEGKRNVEAMRSVEPVSPSARALHQPNWSWISQRAGNEDPKKATPSIFNDRMQDAGYPVAYSGPPAPPKPEIDPGVMMRLELEDKEAEARLAEAELSLAETRVKVETARRAVIAQKLMMAKAGVSPTS